MAVTVPSQLDLWPLSKLVPYSRNSRTHSDEQIAQIAASIREFGFTNPILVDSANGIIAGHGRLEAARRIGLEKVPVIVLDHLSDAQRRAYVIADNKLALNAGWDLEVLSAEISALAEEGFDLEMLGFSEEELEELVDSLGDGSGSGDGDGECGSDEDAYSKKISAPIYEPKGEKPTVGELVDNQKALALIAAITEAEIPESIRRFLIDAAYRHTVFNYEKIAEFYAHSEPEVQELFEASALVIIDFDKAIENGFVVMTKEISDAYPAGPLEDA